MDQREIQGLLAMCHAHDIDCMVRAPTLERTRLYRYLEDGATGLMMPLVSDAGLAREIVEAVKYPPLGNRGLDGAGLDGDFGLDVWHEGSTYINDANRETFIVLQIETPEALANVDEIAAVEGVDVSMQMLVEKINASADVPLTLRLRRDGAQLDVVVTPRLVGGVGLIGVGLSPFEMHTIEPGPFQAFVMSLQQNYESAGMIFQAVGGLFTRDTPVSQLMGPIGIAQLSGDMAQVSWVALFSLMSMISINLGVINLLPIPILDGGHITILAMESIARRDFSVQLKERMLYAGFVVLLTLMVTVIYNDLTRVQWIEPLMFWR